MKNKITVFYKGISDYCLSYKEFDTYKEAKEFLNNNGENGIIIIGTEYHVID